MSNVKHVVSATSSALVKSVSTVGDLFDWAAAHSNESLQRSRIETISTRKSWAADLMLSTQKSLETSTTELTNMGFTAEEIESEVAHILSMFNKK